MSKFGTFEDSLATYVRTDAKGHKVDERAKAAIKLCLIAHDIFVDMMTEVPCDVAAIFSCCLATKAGSDKEFARLSTLKGETLQEAVQKCTLLVTHSKCVPGALVYFEKLRDTPTGAKLYLSVAKELAAHKESGSETEEAPETPSIPLPAEGMLFDTHPSDEDFDNDDNNTSEEL